MRFSTQILADQLVDAIKAHVAREVQELRVHLEETERRAAMRIAELEERCAALERAAKTKPVVKLRAG